MVFLVTWNFGKQKWHVKKKVDKWSLSVFWGNVHYKFMLTATKQFWMEFCLCNKIFCSNFLTSLLYLERSNFSQYFQNNIFFNIFAVYFLRKILRNCLISKMGLFCRFLRFPNFFARQNQNWVKYGPRAVSATPN